MKRQYKRKKGISISKAKKNVYDGISFDSGLEMYTYKQLEKTNLNWEYNPESFLLKPKDVRTFDVWKKTPKNPYHVIKTKNNQQIVYTTDFVIYSGKPADIVHIIECKGYVNERFTVVVKLFYTWAIENLPYLENFFMPHSQKTVDETIKMILGDDI